MTQDNILLKSTSCSSSLVNEKLRLLKEYLGAWKTSNSQSEINFKKINVANLNMTILGQELFEKAPDRTVLGRTIEELANTTKEVHKNFNFFCKNESGIQISFDTFGHRTSVTIIMTDSPFIVRSIMGSFEHHEVQVELFLHPLISVGGRRISFTYIETHKIDDEILESLKKDLIETLDDVKVTTSDFSKMYLETENLANILRDVSRSNGSNQSLIIEEISELLHWLLRSNFLFLGIQQWKSTSNKSLVADANISYGLFRGDHNLSYISLTENEINSHLAIDTNIRFTKLTIKGKVQRRSLPNLILIQIHNDDGTRSIIAFIGLFTSNAAKEDSSRIPIIRRKLNDIIRAEDVDRNSYDYKYIVKALDNIPKEHGFKLTVLALQEFVKVAIGVHNSHTPRVAVDIEDSEWAILLVVIPRKSYSTKINEEIRNYLEKAFACESNSVENFVDFSADQQIRVYYHIPLVDFNYPEIDSIQTQIANMTLDWDEKLDQAIITNMEFPEKQDRLSSLIYGTTFPASYQATHSIDESLADLRELVELSQDSSLKVRMGDFKLDEINTNSEVTITVYALNNTVPSHKSLPIFGRVGLDVSQASIYEVPVRSGDIYTIHRFIANFGSTAFLAEDLNKNIKLKSLEEGLEHIFKEEMEDDILNVLLLNAGLNVAAIKVLRAYSAYLWQIIRYATRGTIYHTLAESPLSSSILYQIFNNRFNPEIKDRTDNESNLVSKFIDSLRNVTNINRDKIFRSLLSIILKTVRTNAYKNPTTLCFKLYSQKLDILPRPKPMFEIFVRSHLFEGIHLRAGKVARGGIRWSDRTDDYRSEVLGLMKTQTAKNVLIVPTGAKGGFTIRYLPTNPSEKAEKVKTCYKEYIRALLSVTDNLVNGQIYHPTDIIRYDEDDPYFVVAADKGTATFSDTANQIASEEFNFWLDDAFASGGSNGYDHKKTGITARGAWEAVKRHFHAISINYKDTPFSVIGIGDMSGDVFGNGMLAHNQIKLIAAFNHKHIFIDPKPDPLRSYSERARLFSLPGSQWSDYSPHLISKGGGVFDRYSKEILLTQEIINALNIPAEVETTINGEELIQHVLKAPCDLLWNGGIGTYVKSTLETHAQVNDSLNDRVRIDAKELRCKIVGEGGNLGFTQKARIEYAHNGGHIHTDAIDNSGGVDLSDHEVNLKILLQSACKNGKYSKQECAQLLTDMVEDVIESVLSHNREHAQLLALGLSRSVQSIHYFQSLIRELEKRSYTNRLDDSLPSNDELIERASRKQGLVIPELATCIAAVKMWVKEACRNSGLKDDPYLSRYLFEYFPKNLRQILQDEILAHPLKADIISCQVANNFINGLGITFLHRMVVSFASAPIHVIKCGIAANFLLEGSLLRETINKLDNPKYFSDFLKIRGRISTGVRHVCSWLVGNHGDTLGLNEIIERYRYHTEKLLLAESQIINKKYQDIIEKEVQHYIALGLTKDEARRIAMMAYLPSIFDILATLKLLEATDCHSTSEKVAELYFLILDILRLERLLDIGEVVETANKWEHQVLINGLESIRRSTSRITSELYVASTKLNTVKATDLQKILESNGSYLPLISTVEEIAAEGPKAESIAVLSRQLESFKV
jgi:glutamate dehydrogenase